MYPEPLRPSAETQAEYTSEWLEIVGQVGPEKFSEGLVNAVRGSEYFPTIKKLRDCCAVSEEKLQRAGSEAAWLYVREHVRKFSSIYSHNAPKLPPRIAYATRVVGGLYQIEYCPDDSLPFMRKDFCAAWERYPESSAAFDSLLLAAPLESPQPKLLQGPDAYKAVKPLTIGDAMSEIGKVKHTAIHELTDAEIEDRREMLRQQAETLKKKFS